MRRRRWCATFKTVESSFTDQIFCSDIKNDSKHGLCPSEHLVVEMLTVSSNETGKDSRRPSFVSQGSAADGEPRVPASVALPTPIMTTLSQQTSPFYPQAVSPLPEATASPRYNSSLFRTPQAPFSHFGSVTRSSPTSISLSK